MGLSTICSLATFEFETRTADFSADEQDGTSP